MKRGLGILLLGGLLAACEPHIFTEPFVPPPEAAEVQADGIITEDSISQAEWDVAAGFMNITSASTTMISEVDPVIPQFWIGTEISTCPLVPCVFALGVYASIRQDYLASYVVDGQSGQTWAPDTYHLAPTLVHDESHYLPAVNCIAATEASWDIASKHFASWNHLMAPGAINRGPVDSDASGSCGTELCEGDCDPPSGGGGGGEPEDCDHYLVTVWTWNGSTWEITHQSIMTICD